MKRPDKCVHYNGCLGNDTCDAGVNYAELAGPGDAYAQRLPCHPQLTGQPKVVCEKKRLPTVEELAEDERETKERSVRIGKVRAAIVEACGGPWKKGMLGVAGSIECPACIKGSVSFTRSGYNGHVHARCSTAGCASWIE